MRWRSCGGDVVIKASEDEGVLWELIVKDQLLTYNTHCVPLIRMIEPSKSLHSMPSSLFTFLTYPRVLPLIAREIQQFHLMTDSVDQPKQLQWLSMVATGPIFVPRCPSEKILCI